jgi:hypothetical protein
MARKAIWYGFLVLASFSIIANTNQAISRAWDIHHNGVGYTSRYWRQSEVVSYLAQMDDVRIIYANGPDAISFLTGKAAVMIPAKVSPHTRRLNENYEEQMSQMVEECIEGKALIIYLNKVTWRWYLPSVEEVESMGAIPILRRLQDEVIYGTR